MHLQIINNMSEEAIPNYFEAKYINMFKLLFEDGFTFIDVHPSASIADVEDALKELNYTSIEVFLE